MSTAGWLSGTDPSWSVLRGKAIFTERKEKSTEADVHLTPSQHLGVLPQTDYMERSGSRVVLNLTGADQMKHVEPNDFVIHLRSFQGGIEHSRYAGKVSNAYTILTPDSRCEPRFFRWVLKCSGFIQELNSLTDQLRDGQSIKYSQFAEINLPLPPIEEQRRIADFLDDQVGRLNDLAHFRANQRRGLEEVLADASARCVAVDSTNSMTRMSRMLRDSCVGVVVNPSSYFVETGVPFVHGYNVRDGWLDLSDLKFMSEEHSRALSRSRLQVGDVLVVRAGYPGRAAVVPPELAGGNCASVLVLRTSQRLIPEFLVTYLNSTRGVAQVRARQYGAAQEVINLADVLDFSIPDLPIAVQSMRLRELAAVQSQCAQAIQGVEKSSRIFEERKRSLITAAVTGQLDVTSARPLTGPWVSNTKSTSVEQPVNTTGVAL